MFYLALLASQASRLIALALPWAKHSSVTPSWSATSITLLAPLDASAYRRSARLLAPAHARGARRAPERRRVRSAPWPGAATPAPAAPGEEVLQSRAPPEASRPRPGQAQSSARALFAACARHRWRAATRALPARRPPCGG